jgi:hypothetical protein
LLIEKVIDYIKIQIEVDLLYVGNFEKSEIPSANFWLMSEKIPSDLLFKKSEINTLNPNFVELNILNPNNNNKSNANYLIFISDIYNNQLMVETVFNRQDGLNCKNRKSEYETWTCQNGGMSYIFTLKPDHTITKVERIYKNY